MRLFRVGEPMALSDVLPAARAPRRPSHRRAALRGAPGRRPRRVGSTTSASPARTSLASTASGRGSSSATRSAGCGAARPRATGSTASCCARACRAARSRSCAPTRSTSARSVRRSARATSRTPSPTNPHIASLLARPVRGPVRPRPHRRSSRGRGAARHEHRRRALRRRGQPRRGPHPLERSCTSSWRRCARAGYRRDAAGNPKPYMSFKLDPARVPDLPLPRPLYEVWVYSPRAEGVHLRGGRIARGGIRWSDRREDFRTEILGLMKAQMVKNAVIVPVGAKGGFVVKRPPPAPDRDALQAEVEACYQILIRGLLDITDNIVGGRGRARRLEWCATTTTTPISSSPPTRAPRRSPTSPTRSRPSTGSGSATRSRPEARRATTTRRWGSPPGARGSRCAGTSTGSASTPTRTRSRSSGSATCPATCSATGCCCQPVIELVGAFDHRHVFLDPKPDPAASFAERKRLFDLPRSSWDDYDRALDLHRWRRVASSAKSIPLSPEVRALLCTDAETPHPGRGDLRVAARPRSTCCSTAASARTSRPPLSRNAEVGDRANDSLRVNGVDLRCKAVVEGGNLGLTQRGRIEYALAGGLVNTDAIDNSAGVDMLRPRGEHQDPPRRRGGRGRPHGQAAQRTPRRDDRRGRSIWCCATTTSRTGPSPNARAQAVSMIDVHARYTELASSSEELIDRTLEFLPTDTSARGTAGGWRRAHDARVRGAPRVHEDDQRARRPRLRPSRRPLRCRRDRALLPDATAPAVPRRDGPTSAATRDRRDADRQQHGEQGRHLLRLPDDRGDRRVGRRQHPRAPRRAGDLRHAGPLDPDRGPRRRGLRPRCSCACSWRSDTRSNEARSGCCAIDGLRSTSRRP